MQPRLIPVRNLNQLASFSTNFENWHNRVHSNLAFVSGLPMGDGSRNVLYKLFWDFHFFIDRIFLWQVGNYAARNGLGGRDIREIINFIESNSHSIIAAI